MLQKLFALLSLSLCIHFAAQSQNKSHVQSSSKASQLRGKEVYKLHCLACHQVDGSGVPNMNPPLSKTKWVMGSKSVLIHQVLVGSQGKVEIDGDKFHNTMPPLPTLTDQEIADVLTYVRSNFKNKYSAVTVAEVKAQRSKVK